MTKLEKLLEIYATERFDNNLLSQSFAFNSRPERSNFVKKLNELQTDYFLYESHKLYKVEVFLPPKITHPNYQKP